MEQMIIKNKRLSVILLSVVCILAVPLAVMQFTSEVNWTIFDFLIAAVLLFGTGLSIEFVLQKVKIKKTRIILMIAILVLLILIWLELAVGIFGTPLAGS